MVGHKVSKWSPRAIWYLRTQLGLTQEDFAEALGTTRQTIINWERGHQTPSNKRAVEEMVH